MIELEFRPESKDVPEIMRRTELCIGQPFVTLPMETRPDEHKVLAVIQGEKIRRGAVEMVFNDTALMNFVYAGLHRSEDNDAPGSLMAEVRALARKLYGSYGGWVEANYGVLCLECNRSLPEHDEKCAAGKQSRIRLPKP